MSTKIRDRRSRKDSSVAETEKTGGYENPVIVAGIGVGAGGTKSLKQLLGKIPSRMGIAYVLVMHPGPSKKILSIRQLRNLTALEVIEATEGMQVLADRIHVMPSDKFLNIAGGRLTLHKPVQCDGMWMPIDHFLCTLAHDFGQRSCGIVLSGAGSDGMLGLSEIKAFGGRTFVEKPGSAEFPEMPQSAIDAGVADGVFAAGAMAEAIATAAEQAQEEIRRMPASTQEANTDIQDILKILRVKIGYDFSGYKPNTLVRRIRRRMTLGKLSSYADYAAFLQEHPDEIGLLQKDLLIGVTEFFRQPHAWEILGEKVIAHIVENARPGSVIRVWVPGCSTGQEAYSLAIVLTEQVKQSGKKVGIQIFATDSDLSALAAARSGSYSKDEIGQTVTAERLKRFFERKEGRYQILKSIREQIVFAPQNLTSDPPFSRIDLISCRNLLMYLEQPVQQKIIVLFHFALREGGFLFLGTAESTGDREDLFDPVSKKWRIYRRIGIGHPAGIEIPVRPTGGTIPSTGLIPVAPPVHRLTLASAAQQMLLDRFAPACVMIDRKLQVLYVHGRVEDYLTFPTGELTTRIVDMAREGLRARLRGAIGKCLEMKRPVSVIARVRRGEKSIPVKATVSPMRHPRETDGLLLVTFEDHRIPVLMSGQRATRESDVQQLSDELKVTREELQSTIEQLESSNDQLKASNEEVTASNEELQSANEELETSKEELQSLNEELNTINARLQEKVGELEGTNNDVLNLLSSTAIATVFLDKELRVKRFTPASTRLLSLIPSDLGRPVADVLLRFADEMLLEDARRVLKELTPIAKEVQAEDGRWYFRRITPYRTQDDRIEGVVLTFVDVSDIKEAEQALRSSEKKYRDLVESANSIIIRWKPDGEIAYVNRYALSFFGYREEEILGRNAMILVPGQDSSGQDLTGLTTAIVEHPEQSVSNEIENILSDGRRVWVQWANKAILDEAGHIREILAIGNDITERKRAEEELRLAHSRVEWLARFPEENPSPVLRVSTEGEVLYCNPAAMELEGWKCVIGRPMPAPVLSLVSKANAEDREVRQDFVLGEKTYSVAVTSFPTEGYANVYGRDITERKRAEDALRQSREDLDRAQAVGQIGSWRLDVLRNVLTWSDENHRIFGVPKGTPLTYETFLGIVHLDDRQYVDTQWTAGLAGEPYDIEHRIVVDGQVKWVREKAYLEFDDAGRLLGGFGITQDITERKRAEEVLQTTLQRFYNVLSSMYAAVLLVKDDGSIEFTNQAFCDMYSLKESPVSLNGLTSQEIVERIKNAYRQPDEAVTRIREIVRVGQPVKGEEVDMSGGRTCLRDFIPIIVNGISYGRLWHHLDITERKRAEAEFQRLAQQRRLALDSANMGWWHYDPISRVASWDERYKEIFGVTGNSRPNDEILARLHPDDLPGVWAKVEAALDAVNPQPYSAEYRINLPDGSMKWIEAHGVASFEGVGENRRAASFVGTVTDITARKLAEEALWKAKDELEERVKERTYELYAESLYARSLIEASLDPLVTISVDGKIMDVNHASEEVTGVPRELLIGSDFSDYFTEPEKARAGYEEVFRQGFVRDYPLELKRRDGQVTPVLYNASVYRGETGKIMGVFAAARDITERKQAESALRKLASELVMAEERERKRIAGVLHDDIAQILAAARMRLDLLQGISPDQQDQKTLKDAKALLVQSIQETRSLMNDLGNPLLFDMGLKPACEALAERLMERHPVRIRCDIRDAYKHLDPDVKTILYQLIRELMNNVVKHSQAQNAHVLIDMEDGHFRVKVMDDGVGFDPQMLGVPTIEGGYGLYSIRERLMAVGGSLRIESTPGAGTVVTAVLPAALD